MHRNFIGPPHDRLIRDSLPTNLVVRAAAAGSAKQGPVSASNQLSSLVALMRE
jgi:AraC family transcriptional activator of mtrCDE